MNNIVKYIYCVSIKNNIEFGKAIRLYAGFTNLWDQRALSCGSYKRFNVDDDDAPDQLLYYLEHKDECLAKARTRLDEIAELNGFEKVV